MLPELNDTDFIVLADLIKNYPREFYTDMTGFYITEMYNYIDEGRIWRTSVMGPTRSGKSELVSSLCFVYVKRFNWNITQNTYLKNNTIKTIFENENISLQKIEFNTDFLYGSEQEYSTKQRQRTKDNEIVFGQVHQIDEDRKSMGGLGSMSAHIEAQNINNISAKFNQSEFYITPDYMITRNAPYGIRIYKKDMERRINYGLLYKIELNNTGNADFKFLGWVGIPLHPYEDFRISYNKIKDGWILQEVQGGSDKRSQERFKISEQLALDDVFQLKDNGKGFKFTRAEKQAYFEQQIIKGVYPNYNELEKVRIVEQANLIVKTTGQVSSAQGQPL